MNKYIKVYNTHSEFNADTTTRTIYPGIAYCKRENEVHYYEPDYTTLVLTLEALEDNTWFKFTQTLQYRLNSEGSWETLEANTQTPLLSRGQTIQFTGTLLVITDGYEPLGIGTFSSNNKFNAFGNIISLLGPLGSQVAVNNGQFKRLFKSTKIVDASNLILPGNNVVQMSQNCFEEMFNGCSYLVASPKLPATDIAPMAYCSMFRSCASLQIAPELPATTLNYNCYGGMFAGCTSLSQAPALPATTLAPSCYERMFDGCTSLTVAPDLKAETLVQGCYNYMFTSCTHLSYIVALFTTTPSNTYTNSWVEGVAATGTFLKKQDATWNVTGTNGVPPGWTAGYYYAGSGGGR